MMILSAILISVFCFADMSPVWELSDGVSNPESVYYDDASKFIYVSNIAGDGTAKDGNGWIQKLTTSGRIVNAKWVEGLNAPKGMRAHNGTLWITDIDTVISIDTKSGKILKQIQIPQAQFLNDIAVTPTNVVFVSDTIGRAIYQIKKGKVEVFFKGDETESPNGLLIQGDKLIVAAWGLAEKDWSSKVPGHLYSIDIKTKVKKLITKKPLGNLDGLELLEDGSYLVSDWMAGLIYKVKVNGETSQLPVKREQGLADIGYIPLTGTLLVPYMTSSHVVSYNLRTVKADDKK